MLSLKTIDDIRELPIEQVLQKYVQLKRSGSSYKGCCPLHGEKTPSFMVNPVKNIFKCFGCGAGGDAIEFVMLHNNFPFMEACKEIASDNGIQIEEKEVKGKTEEQLKEEDVMLQLLQLAQVEYRKSLDLPTVKYLVEQRKLTRETIIEWQLGLCNDWKTFTAKAISSGHFAIAEKAGLVRSKDGNNYDIFHHRITVPIHDRRGQVIGFGGRITKGEGPKYLNSPDSSVYNKSKTLFGLHKAIKNFKHHGMAVLVEGYFDVIKLHQVGWNNTVASCGTALTEQHAKMLKRYTDTVLILRDGDKAGLAAIKKDIPILAAQQFIIYVANLPEGEDPDTLFEPVEKAVKALLNYQDGIEYLCDIHFQHGKTSATEMAIAIEEVVKLLSLITSRIRVEQYIKILAKRYGLKPPELSKPLDKYLRQLQEEKDAAEADRDESEMPVWVDKRRLEEDGFVQLVTATKGFKPGIYFRAGEGKSLFRTTNFTLKPLYHIYEQSNNRRLVEVCNCIRTSVVEMPSEAMNNQNAFENELIKRGNFRTEFEFSKKHFKRLTGWLSDNMNIAYELKTLGWQPEGFFSFSDAVYHEGTLMQFDEMGMIKIEDKHYMSLGKSKIHKDERGTDNPYENDLYLQLKTSPITFQEWAKLFHTCYGVNAPYGIAFAFLTLFKDVATKVSKMPMLYCYGPKGSGKSALAESLTWLFFSGKNGEKELIKAYNLNPGQGTPFSFFNRIERFRNCPILFNEFDENTVEDWKFGTFKSAYDGEGREVGDGDTGKKRKTRIQKVQGTLIVVGQYMSIKDDGAVLSRSISCQFSLERLSNLSKEQEEAHKALTDAEQKGLSSLLLDLLKHREDVVKKLPLKFIEVHNTLIEDSRRAGQRVEARLINNYSLLLAATKLIAEIISLPYSYEEFYKEVLAQVMSHNKLLKDNSAIHQFWKAVEFLFDIGTLKSGTDLKIMEHCLDIDIKVGSEIERKKFGFAKNLILVRFSNVYAVFSKYHRERSGKASLPEDTLLLYMKEQPYYVGLTPYAYFDDKRTSAFVFDYDKMKELGIVLEKQNHRQNLEPDPADKNQMTIEAPQPILKSDEMPF
jgi:DNA primase